MRGKLIWLILIALSVYLLIIVSLSLIMEKKNRIRSRLNSLKKDEPEKERNEISDKNLLSRLFGPVVHNLSTLTGKFIPVGSDAFQKRSKELRKAHLKMTVAEYYTAMFLCAGALFVVIFLLQPGIKGLMLAVVSALLGVELFRVIIMRRGNDNIQKMQREFPDVLDLLTISISAGASFEQAMNNLVANDDGLLSDEIRTVLTEIGMGLSRKQALKNMAERIDLESFTMFVSAVNQAEDLGMSLSQIMATQADAARDEVIQNVRTESMKLPVKMLFPMILLIFPAIFIILLGPAIMNIMNNI